MKYTIILFLVFNLSHLYAQKWFMLSQALEHNDKEEVEYIAIFVEDTILQNCREYLEGINKFQNLNRIAIDIETPVIPIVSSKIPRLKYLSIEDNSIVLLDSLFLSIQHCDSLRLLSIMGCKIEQLPPEIQYLRNIDSLKELRLSHNYISTLPDEVFQLSNIKELTLDDNSMSYISNNIQQMGSLQTLALEYNKFKDTKILFHNLSKCPNLKILSLNNNPIKRISNNMDELISVETILFLDFKVRLPKDMTLPPNLDMLCFGRVKGVNRKLPDCFNNYTGILLISPSRPYFFGIIKLKRLQKKYPNINWWNN